MTKGWFWDVKVIEIMLKSHAKNVEFLIIWIVKIDKKKGGTDLLLLNHVIVNMVNHN